MKHYGKSRGTFHAGGSDIMMPPQSPSHLALTLPLEQLTIVGFAFCGDVMSRTSFLWLELEKWQVWMKSGA